MSLFLASCLYPEKFSSEVWIGKNGNFEFRYDGMLTFVLALAEKEKTGSISQRTEKAMKELEAKLREDEGFKKVKYLGDARYEVEYEAGGRLDKPFSFIDETLRIFSILPQKGGLVTVQGFKLNEKDVRKLQALGLKIDGELTVKTDAEVVEHNADSTLGLFGLVGGYTWKIRSLQKLPKIVIRLESPETGN